MSWLGEITYYSVYTLTVKWTKQCQTGLQVVGSVNYNCLVDLGVRCGFGVYPLLIFCALILTLSFSTSLQAYLLSEAS